MYIYELYRNNENKTNKRIIQFYKYQSFLLKKARDRNRFFRVNCKIKVIIEKPVPVPRLSFSAQMHNQQPDIGRTDALYSSRLPDG